jgi:hypothetical protein
VPEAASVLDLASVYQVGFVKYIMVEVMESTQTCGMEFAREVGSWV